jgi:hypothetical protein
VVTVKIDFCGGDQHHNAQFSGDFSRVHAASSTRRQAIASLVDVMLARKA